MTLARLFLPIVKRTRDPDCDISTEVLREIEAGGYLGYPRERPAG